MKPAAFERQSICDNRASRILLGVTRLTVLAVLLILGGSQLFAADDDIMGFLKDADEKLSKIREPDKLLQDVRDYQREIQDVEVAIKKKIKSLEWLRGEQDNAPLVIYRDELALTIKEYDRALKKLEKQKKSLEGKEKDTWKDYKRVIESREKDLKTNSFESGSTTNKPDTSSKPKKCAYCGRIGCPGPLSHDPGKAGVLGDLKEVKPR
jgi:hypothetical protein